MKTFNSLDEFHSYLLTLPVQFQTKQTEFLEGLGVALKETAKEKIGHLQPADGQFKAWDPLAKSTLEDKARKGLIFNDEGNPLFRDGTLRNSIESRVEVMPPNGAHLAIGSDMDIALWQEMGTSRIPARSFLGATMFEATKMISLGMQEMFVAWLAGTIPKYEFKK